MLRPLCTWSRGNGSVLGIDMKRSCPLCLCVRDCGLMLWVLVCLVLSDSCVFRPYVILVGLVRVRFLPAFSVGETRMLTLFLILVCCICVYLFPIVCLLLCTSPHNLVYLLLSIHLPRIFSLAFHALMLLCYIVVLMAVNPMYNMLERGSPIS